jgi:tetratricopeptide (TPR) repeat protein
MFLTSTENQKAKAKRQKEHFKEDFFNKVFLPFCLLTFAIYHLPFCPAVFGETPEETAQNHYQTGLAYERLGRLEEAYTELQLAFALDDQDTNKALALGVVASRLGRFAEAQRALEHSIVTDANSVASYYHLALLYEIQDQTERAMESWHRFLQLSQDEELKLIARKHVERLEGHR